MFKMNNAIIAIPYAAQIRFVRGRLKFGDVNTAAPFSSAFVIFSETLKFEDRFVWYEYSVSEAKKKGLPQVAGHLPNLRVDSSALF